MKKITIKTNLLGRNETFKMLAVGHVTGYPVLLVGPPGVGKTRALLDYSMGLHNNNAVDALEKTFILETDEGTRPAEIKGRVDISKLFLTGKDANGKDLQPVWEVNSPISQAKMVLINEIDKANPGLRNSMLGVMNEKMLFNGQSKVYCPWELFCASCNVIPRDEEGNPFWDRFVLKHKVNRLTKSQMLQYYGMKSKAPVEINLPDSDELADAISKIPQGVMTSFVEVTYDMLSDRSLSYVPRIIAAVGVVFDMPVKKAAIKACEMLLSAEAAKKLAPKLEPKVVTELRNNIDFIKTLQDYDQIIKHVEQITNMAKQAAQYPEVSKEDMTDLSQDLKKALNEHPVYSAGQQNLKQSFENPTSQVAWNQPAEKF